MPRCEVCENDYDKTFEIMMPGESKPHTFDSFECAIHALAPKCYHCGCKIVGHGVETGDAYYCCVNCANLVGAGGLKDRT